MSNDRWFEHECKEYDWSQRALIVWRTHAVNVGLFIKELFNSNANLRTIIQTKYEKYVDDRFNHSVSITDKKNAFQYLMDNSSSEF